MKPSWHMRKDYYAGALIALIGGCAAWQGQSYKVGTLTHMGPGFFPLVLGVLLMIVGASIGVAGAVSAEAARQPFFKRAPQWRAWGCILASPMLFIAIGRYFGLLPATFLCVFVCAMGDAEARWRNSLLLAAGVAVLGSLLFVYVLHISFPVLRLPVLAR